jgi:hypothetical protein
MNAPNYRVNFAGVCQLLDPPHDRHGRVIPAEVMIEGNLAHVATKNG